MPAGSHSSTLISLMRGVAMPRVARATCSCDRKRGEARPNNPAPPMDFNNSRRFMDPLNFLSPPVFALCQMSFYHVRVQLRAEAWLVDDTDMPVFDIRTIQQQHLVHPATHAGDGFTGNIVADRRRPLTISPSMQLTPGVVRRHRQSKCISHICDAFRLQETA